MAPAVEAAASLGGACAAWSWNVVHKKAPGAMNAIAFTVTAVNPRVGFIPVPDPSARSGGAAMVLSAMNHPFKVVAWLLRASAVAIKATVRKVRFWRGKGVLSAREGHHSLGIEHYNVQVRN